MMLLASIVDTQVIQILYSDIQSVIYGQSQLHPEVSQIEGHAPMTVCKPVAVWTRMSASSLAIDDYIVWKNQSRSCDRHACPGLSWCCSCPRQGCCEKLVLTALQNCTSSQHQDLLAWYREWGGCSTGWQFSQVCSWQSLTICCRTCIPWSYDDKNGGNDNDDDSDDDCNNKDDDSYYSCRRS